MDQLKNILRQIVKQRFWIAVGVAALLPMIAYFSFAGSMQEATKKKATEIKSADTAVKKYMSGNLPNQVYVDVVKEKTDVVKTEVEKVQRILYERQIPLMTWPKVVEDQFPAWGMRAYPKTVDPNTIQQAIFNYIDEFPNYVDQIYQTFQPWDPEKGAGLVAAPGKEELLRAPEFNIKNPPTLKQIWDAQERLWLQRSLFDVIAKVNEGAKDWDSAVIKQITMLEVATPTAQDQPTATKETKLAKSTDIFPEGYTPPVETTKSSSGSMSSMPSGATGGLGGTGKGELGEVYSAEAPGKQYRLFPVALGVLMDKDQIFRLLTELQNSPMVIQVKEVEMMRPATSVVKPTKGDSKSQQFNLMAASPMSGAGPNRSTFLYSPQAMMAASSSSSSIPAYDARMGGRAPATGANKSEKSAGAGKDVRDRFKKAKKDQAKEKEEEETKAAEPTYPNVVQVTVYGQARFYAKPPDPAEAAGSQADTATGAGPKGGADAAKGKAEPAKGDSEDAEEKAEAEAPKQDTRAAKDTKAGRDEADQQPETDEEKEKPETPKARGAARPEQEDAEEADPPKAKAKAKPTAPRSRARTKPATQD